MEPTHEPKLEGDVSPSASTCRIPTTLIPGNELYRQASLNRSSAKNGPILTSQGDFRLVTLRAEGDVLLSAHFAVLATGSDFFLGESWQLQKEPMPFIDLDSGPDAVSAPTLRSYIRLAYQFCFGSPQNYRDDTISDVAAGKRQDNTTIDANAPRSRLDLSWLVPCTVRDANATGTDVPTSCSIDAFRSALAVWRLCGRCSHFELRNLVAEHIDAQIREMGVVLATPRSLLPPPSLTSEGKGAFILHLATAVNASTEYSVGGKYYRLSDEDEACINTLMNLFDECLFYPREQGFVNSVVDAFCQMTPRKYAEFDRRQWWIFLERRSCVRVAFGGGNRRHERLYVERMFHKEITKGFVKRIGALEEEREALVRSNPAW